MASHLLHATALEDPLADLGAHGRGELAREFVHQHAVRDLLRAGVHLALHAGTLLGLLLVPPPHLAGLVVGGGV